MTVTSAVTPSSNTHLAPHPVPVAESARRIRDVLPDLVRQAPVGVGVVRKDRTVAYRNDEFARIMGVAAETAAVPKLGLFRQADGAPLPAEREPLVQLFRAGRTTTEERLVLQRLDGGSVDVSLTMAPIVDANREVVGAILYVQDLTADLEDASLREAFVGVLSHELRTPITSIYGGTQLLLDERLPATMRTAVIHDIAAEAEQLHRLVEDLLAIARVERGLTQVAADPVLIQRLATQAAVAEERRWPGRVVEVHAPSDFPAVLADDGYTTQILRNLISNAVKYSPADQPVVVTIDREGSMAVVTVLDRGRGFPDDVGSDAFRLFYRSPAVAARVAGTGIGLYVARALVEAQGGQIWLRNRAGGGAEVGFALPLYGLEEA